ncbi:tryptophan synthase beta subunit-like PLP-dependent enzyme [Aspergillus costaricaensis CBS 115574]|uniref:Tryptophan synthase beta subunit-like PLP-dependent enzyme n=1 Tax=Aspergillus costaricaensis CBS 115574 TaxID=1448317 RepID=A0ACD1I798_9EURO|nr:tryptophan synthase beta subunit-like PLP-dependent enzyme [Aspergillus costaricaensis CBS 115574]RAK86386.1 tryptophan synthase beta subunit-like PLP-dependent enzyme [Aspergillus costaricaensis CBS 115574]
MRISRLVKMQYSYHHNTERLSSQAEATAAVCMRNLSNWMPAVDEIRTWPEYTIQPLRALPNLAHKLGVREIFVKDESKRFGTGMGSFKALGAPYSVYRILAEEVHAKKGVWPSAAELRTDKYRDITNSVTVCVATDGNQGRGLAYGAKTFGCHCVDYIHNHVSDGRAKRMMDLGAIVIRINGEYETSVARAKEDARMNGWYFVSSTSWSDFDNDVPQHVMNAYMVVLEEAIALIPQLDRISHVFVCGGVGSIAAAIFQGFYTHLRGDKNTPAQLPRFVVVEPLEADCLLQSAKNGTAYQSKGTLCTLMAGLACRAPSPAAWKLLNWLASDFLAVPDSIAVEGMKALANGDEGDIPVVCGESSAASMGVLLESVSNSSLRESLGLDENSQVIIFGLEGATDPDIYESLVGKSPTTVFEAQDRFHAKACTDLS